MPDWIIQLVTNAGPTAAIMAYMWFQERRRADDMTSQLLTALKEQNKVNDAVREALLKNEAS